MQLSCLFSLNSLRIILSLNHIMIFQSQHGMKQIIGFSKLCSVLIVALPCTSTGVSRLPWADGSDRSIRKPCKQTMYCNKTTLQSFKLFQKCLSYKSQGLCKILRKLKFCTFCFKFCVDYQNINNRTTCDILDKLCSFMVDLMSGYQNQPRGNARHNIFPALDSIHIWKEIATF